MIKPENVSISVCSDDNGGYSISFGGMGMGTTVGGRATTVQEIAEVAIRMFIGHFALDTPENCGSKIAGSCWFHGEPEFNDDRQWLCVVPECEGVMMSAGWMWPTGDPGIHHTCNACGFTAAIHESALAKRHDATEKYPEQPNG